MGEKNNNKYDAEMTTNDYLSLLQIKYDWQTLHPAGLYVLYMKLP